MTKQSILIRDLDMRPLFTFDFYGLDRELTSIDAGPIGRPPKNYEARSGGWYVARALERRGINPSSVFFTIWDVTS